MSSHPTTFPLVGARRDEVLAAAQRGFVGLDWSSGHGELLDRVRLFAPDGSAMVISSDVAYVSPGSWEEIGYLQIAFEPSASKLGSYVALPDPWRGPVRIEKLVVSLDEVTAECGIRLTIPGCPPLEIVAGAVPLSVSVSGAPVQLVEQREFDGDVYRAVEF